MSGELSAEQLRSFFDQDVRPYLEGYRVQVSGGQSQPPVVVYVDGQPGAGKSRANERATQERPSLVPVIGDDLRQFHPDYARLMRDDPLAMPEVTSQASGRWIGMSADYLREQRADVLIETTLRSPDAMARTIEGFREAGYVVELRVVAVPQEVSRLSTVERHTGQIEVSGAGRWTPAIAHDEAYARATGTVESLVSSGIVDRFVIEDRVGTVLFDESYSGARDDELAVAGRQASAAFDHARAVEQMTPDAARAWIELAHKQIEYVRGLRRQDTDMLSTVERIGTIDARAVATRAYPQDPERVNEATESLGAVARVAARSVARASFPRAATQAIAQPPQTGPHGSSHARYKRPHMPGQGYQGPDTNTPGINR